jgi:tetratricopeptide (TPR) repeat protein
MPPSAQSKALAIALFQEGWALERTGRVAEAAERYDRALRQDRDCFEALVQLGRLRLGEGKTEEAVGFLRRAVKANPRVASAHRNLAVLLFQTGRFDEALASFEKVVALGPPDAEALTCRGDCQNQLGRLEEAVASYDAAIALKPGLPQAHTNRAYALQRLGRLEEALDGYDRARALQPNAPGDHYNCASVLHALGRLDEALAGYDAAIALHPGFAEAHFGRGAVLLAIEDCEGAVHSYIRAAQARPTHAETWAHLGQALAVLGRSMEASEAAERALREDASSADAWYIRASLKPFRPGDPDLPRMEAALRQAEARQARPEDRLNLSFALGKAWMEAGDAGRALGHLNRANQQQRSLLDFDIDAHLAAMDAMARALDSGTIRRLDGLGHRSERPVFIVGMPRSGTSLVEQVLASHPEVHGAGELTLIGEMAGRLPRAGEGLVEALTPDRLAAMGAEYDGRVQAMAPGAARVTDKMPGNLLYAGLISLILPEARIIHCVRDPLDTCLSCYETRFRRGSLFSYDLRELGLSHRAQDQLAQHWRKVLPSDRFTQVSYEAMVEDLEGEARRLLAFCGLEWDDACLQFHQTQRTVWTASASQVRRPLYRSSVGRARACADHLGPLVEALGTQERLSEDALAG